MGGTLQKALYSIVREREVLRVSHTDAGRRVVSSAACDQHSMPIDSASAVSAAVKQPIGTRTMPAPI
jgi:hypothetical protein